MSRRSSPPIAHGLDVNYVAIVMAHGVSCSKRLSSGFGATWATSDISRTY